MISKSSSAQFPFLICYIFLSITLGADMVLIRAHIFGYAEIPMTYFI